MRFRSQLSDIGTFASEFYQSIRPNIAINHCVSTEFIASLSSLGKICWMRLEESVVRFTIIPDQGTQAWATLPIVSMIPRNSNYTAQLHSSYV